MSLPTRCFSSVKAVEQKSLPVISRFSTFGLRLRRAKEPSHMALAALLVGVAQLIVAIIALVITIRRK